MPRTISFSYLKDGLGLVPAALLLGGVSLLLALVSILSLEETYAKDLDYTEPI